MIILQINNNTAEITGEISQKAEDWIISSNKLGFLENKTLVPEIFKKLNITENEVYIKKYWADEICLRGGWYKREFINWQILAFEFWEELFSDQQNLKIFVNDIEFELNTKKPIKREKKNVIQMIKLYKRFHRTSRGDCKAYQTESLNKHSQLCCLCGQKDILLLRRKK